MTSDRSPNFKNVSSSSSASNFLQLTSSMDTPNLKKRRFRPLNSSSSNLAYSNDSQAKLAFAEEESHSSDGMDDDDEQLWAPPNHKAHSNNTTYDVESEESSRGIVMNDESRYWVTLLPQNLDFDVNLLITLKIRGEEAAGYVPEKLYSSHKYYICHSVSGSILNYVKGNLKAQLFVEDPSTEEEVRTKDGKVIVKHVNSTLAPELSYADGQLETQMRVQFTSSSYKFGKGYFCMSFIYSDTRTGEILFKAKSPSFRVYARKPSTDEQTLTPGRKKKTTKKRKRRMSSLDSNSTQRKKTSRSMMDEGFSLSPDSDTAPPINNNNSHVPPFVTTRGIPALPQANHTDSNESYSNESTLTSSSNDELNRKISLMNGIRQQLFALQPLNTAIDENNSSQPPNHKTEEFIRPSLSKSNNSTPQENTPSTLITPNIVTDMKKFDFGGASSSSKDFESKPFFLETTNLGTNTQFDNNYAVPSPSMPSPSILSPLIPNLGGGNRTPIGGGFYLGDASDMMAAQKLSSPSSTFV